MTVKSNKQPKISANTKIPDHKTTRIKNNPESNRDSKPCWQFSFIDVNGRWGWKAVSGEQWWSSIFPKLKDFETMTWQEIINASGGRTVGNNNHEVNVSDIVPAARTRLKELGHDDITSLFSLRFGNTIRIWGVLEGRLLKILWFDPRHEIYKIKK